MDTYKIQFIYCDIPAEGMLNENSIKDKVTDWFESNNKGESQKQLSEISKKNDAIKKTIESNSVYNFLSNRELSALKNKSKENERMMNFLSEKIEKCAGNEHIFFELGKPYIYDIVSALFGNKAMLIIGETNNKTASIMSAIKATISQTGISGYEALSTQVVLFTAITGVFDIKITVLSVCKEELAISNYANGYYVHLLPTDKDYYPFLEKIFSKQAETTEK